MKVAFFGYKRAFGYDQIGGVESVVRRFAKELVLRGHSVDYVCYGVHVENIVVVENNFRLLYTEKFSTALEQLESGYDHVVCIYIHPIYRMNYLKFRIGRHRRNLFFHYLLPGGFDSITGWLSFICSVAIPSINGFVFVTSPRYYRKLSKFIKCVKLIIPPVPDEYFLPLEEKISTCSTVTFIGRLDLEKGTSSVDMLYKRLQDHLDLELRLFGYTWSASVAQHELSEVSWKNGIHREDIVSFDGYSATLDERLKNCLFKTDYLLLPYKSLVRTMDPPLLLLEGMAALCGVITVPVGDIAEIYGSNSSFMVRKQNFDVIAESLIMADENILTQERRRIAKRLETLNCQSSVIGEKFCNLLEKKLL